MGEKEDKSVEEKREEIVNKIKGYFSKIKDSTKANDIDSNSENNQNTSSDDEDTNFKDELVEQRKELLKTLKEKKSWIIYIFLGIVIWFGTYIRTRNWGILKDITTGNYIPQALDPYLFLKYARYIVEHGALLAHDPTRFVPQGTSTVGYVFMSSFIAYLYKFLHIFNPNLTLEFVDIIYPAVCFVFAMFFFFLLVRRLFDWKTGVVATLFLSIVPAFLHRTMSGFSDHEALAIMFMFMAMYFYVRGWQSEKTGKSILWGSLAGISTGLFGLTWGGWKFLILIISVFVLIEFFFDKIDRKGVYQYIAWVVFFTITSTTWIPVYNFKLLFSSSTTAIAYLVLFMLIVDLVFFKLELLKIKDKLKGKMPLRVASFTFSFVLGILLLLAILGPTALASQVGEISDSLLHPLGNDRWQLTVAEQHQPYFTDWVGNFGPQFLRLTNSAGAVIFSGIPIYLTLFILGSVILFYNMVRKHKKKLLFTAIYLIFILLFIMSRHSPNSIFNGTNFISKLAYLGSLATFSILAVIFYFKSFYKNKEEYNKILSWDKKYIFVLVWFLIMIVAARGASRLFFIFAPITAVIAGYAAVELSKYSFKIKKDWQRYTAIFVLFLILLCPFTFGWIYTKGVVPVFSASSLEQGKYSGPGYNQQWQLAGAWARENVPEDAVFGHWWDYGYWVQEGFQRATVLDGANKIKYWNYLMGRHVLTAQTQNEALEFLKVHEATHYLIVSDEIGKYTAYSSIGSDADHDRYSWITTFQRNEQATQETRNTTVYVYQGSYVLDDDFVWEGIVYPRAGSGVAAVFLPITQIEEQQGDQIVTTFKFEQPTIALIKDGKRVDVPMECLYFNGELVTFSQPGYKGCFRLIPTIDNSGQIADPLGAGLFISEEGRNALWVNLYVFNQRNPEFKTDAFKLIYQDSYISDIALLNGRLFGPIKIWDIDYPEGFSVSEELKEKYLGGNELLPDYFYDVN